VTAVLIVAMICGTVLAVAGLAYAFNREPPKLREARVAREVEQERTLTDLEKWRQDWMLDAQQHQLGDSKQLPSLPPGDPRRT
jgi:hypothetical protein